MAAPAYLAGGFRVLSVAGVSDVATIITNLVTELVSNGWTDTGGAGTGPVKSPVGDDGTYITVTLIRETITRLRYNVRDNFGRMVNCMNTADPLLITRQDIDAGGTTVGIYSGPDYFFVDSERATRELFGACKLQTHPYVSGVHVRTSFAATNGPRDYNGGLSAQTIFEWGVWPLETANYSSVGNAACYRGYSENIVRRHPTGAYVHRPINIVHSDGSWFGIVPQVIMIHDGLAFGATYTVVIDSDGNTGTFKVIGWAARTQAKGAVRVA